MSSELDLKYCERHLNRFIDSISIRSQSALWKTFLENWNNLTFLEQVCIFNKPYYEGYDKHRTCFQVIYERNPENLVGIFIKNPLTATHILFKNDSTLLDYLYELTDQGDKSILELFSTQSLARNAFLIDAAHSFLREIPSNEEQFPTLVFDTWKKLASNYNNFHKLHKNLESLDQKLSSLDLSMTNNTERTLKLKEFIQEIYDFEATLPQLDKAEAFYHLSYNNKFKTILNQTNDPIQEEMSRLRFTGEISSNYRHNIGEKIDTYDFLQNYSSSVFEDYTLYIQIPKMLASTTMLRENKILREKHDLEKVLQPIALLSGIKKSLKI